MIEIRRFRPSDWDSVWQILEPVFRAGETYVFSPDVTEDEARQAWVERPSATYVVTIDERVAGTYYIKPKQPGLGDHVCNCGYVVAETARGHGIASEMCLHSQATAVEEGFQAMQYNFVVSTNEGAIRLWEKHGFQVVGRIPDAFRHPKHSFVDAVVMYKKLGDD